MSKFWWNSMLLVIAVGCGQSGQTMTNNPAPSNPETIAPAKTSLPEGAMLVTLKLPEMSCGFCAAAVRSELANVEGVSDIQTDVKNQTCKFQLANKDLDLKAKLDELAQSNEHIKGFEIVTQ